MNKEELTIKLEQAIGTYSNSLTKSIAKDCAEIVFDYLNDQWISVQDRFPPDNLNVLCYHSSGNYFISYRTKDCFTNEPKWFNGRPDYWRLLNKPLF